MFLIFNFFNIRIVLKNFDTERKKTVVTFKLNLNKKHCIKNLNYFKLKFYEKENQSKTKIKISV